MSRRAKRMNRGRRAYMHALNLSAVLAMMAAPAGAQISKCATPEEMARALAEHYQEARVSIALDAKNRVVETFASESGSWTIVITAPGKLSCAVASGEAFQLVKDSLSPLGDEM